MRSGTSKAKVLWESVIVVIFAQICTWPASSGSLLSAPQLP